VKEIFYIENFNYFLEEPLVLNSILNFSHPEWWKEKEKKFRGGGGLQELILNQ
jgi:hypothetical protein